MADEFTVQPESTATQDGASCVGGLQPHPNEWIFIAGWWRRKSAGNEPVCWFQGREGKGPSIPDQWFNLSAPWNSNRDKQRRVAALLHPSCHQAGSRLVHLSCEEEWVLREHLWDEGVDLGGVHAALLLGFQIDWSVGETSQCAPKLSGCEQKVLQLVPMAKRASVRTLGVCSGWNSQD
jgi:hypothetical protein